MITTRVNIPVVIGFNDEAEANAALEVIGYFINKVKTEHVGTDEAEGKELYLFYTRKDKKYSELKEEFENAKQYEVLG